LKVNTVHNSDYSILLEGEIESLIISSLLWYFFGHEYTPPLGFNMKPQLTFSYDKDAPYPTSKVCDNQLELLTMYGTYDEFIEIFITALHCNGGYGYP
jgi:hypothetical protein